MVRDIESVDESEVALRCVTVNGKRHPKFMEDTAIADSGTSCHLLRSKWIPYMLNKTPCRGD